MIDGIGVVESHNKVLVLVTSDEAATKVRSAARSLGIPEGAVTIGRSHAQPVNDLTTGTFRPTIGGIKISNGTYGCTLWGNV
jgi:hypothetical protein